MCLEVSGDVQRRKAKPAIQYGMNTRLNFFLHVIVMETDFVPFTAQYRLDIYQNICENPQKTNLFLISSLRQIQESIV